MALVACSSPVPSRHVASDDIGKDFVTFDKHFKSSLIWRSEAMKLIMNIETETKGGALPLKSKNISDVFGYAKEFLRINWSLDNFVKEDKATILAELIEPIRVPPTVPTGAESYYIQTKMLERFKDLSSIQRMEMLLRVKRVLAAEMIVSDNYFYVLNPILNNPKLRRMLPTDNAYLSPAIRSFYKKFTSLERRLLLQRLFLLDNMSEEILTSTKTYDGYLDYASNAALSLNPFLTESYSYHLFKDKGRMIFANNLQMWLGFFTGIADKTIIAKDYTTYLTSMGFGNTVGLVAFRKGKLLSLSLEEQNQLASELQPLDVLFEKTPFRLTDKFIPGHFGHVAIWIGTEAQLKELGVWDHPSVVPYHQDIRNGARIVEALRPGVQFNTLHHFLNIDDFLAVRKRTPLTTEEKRHYLIKAFKQINKKYDFNFDVETDKTIVCSEIAYVVYENEDWVTVKTAGRYTISPDDVVKKAYSDGPFMPVVFYHDGVKLRGDIQKMTEDIVNEAYE